MAALRNVFSKLNQQHLNYFCYKFVSTERLLCQAVQNVQKNEEKPNSGQQKKSDLELAEYRFVYPEFLPNPKFKVRHKICEKLEREDMLRRRSVIVIPEFYVGSIMAVTTADPHAPSKENRFVGICISRSGIGLRANFILRNMVNKQGVELFYDMYNPSILHIEVLKLEKRLDDSLFYLRDALPEYSTFPFDMEAEFIVEGQPVPVNPLKVKLKPRPWHCRWERFDLQGVEKFELKEKLFIQARKLARPWEKYDLMKQYRHCIPEEDQKEIWEDVDRHHTQFQSKRQQQKRKVLQKAPSKT